jgi:hypothetical protein
MVPKAIPEANPMKPVTSWTLDVPSSLPNPLINPDYLLAFSFLRRTLASVRRKKLIFENRPWPVGQ